LKIFVKIQRLTIEREVLGEIRIEDIPGEQIPLEYFRYLDTKDATVMKKVLSHNESDILTLAALLVRFSRMVKNRFFSEEVVELTGLSKLYEKRENYDSMTECLERRFNLVPDAWDFDSLRRISVIYKRTGRYDKALSLWRYYFEKEDLDTAIGLKVYAGTEIAKYLEHKERDYLSALKTVNELIVFLKSKRIFAKKYLPELDKRKSRLEKLVKRR
jgi:tetratricopeptide (TPR) repeat protein